MRLWGWRMFLGGLKRGEGREWGGRGISGGEIR